MKTKYKNVRTEGQMFPFSRHLSRAISEGLSLMWTQEVENLESDGIKELLQSYARTIPEAREDTIVVERNAITEGVTMSSSKMHALQTTLTNITNQCTPLAESHALRICTIGTIADPDVSAARGVMVCSNHTDVDNFVLGPDSFNALDLGKVMKHYCEAQSQRELLARLSKFVEASGQDLTQAAPDPISPLTPSTSALALANDTTPSVASVDVTAVSPTLALDLPRDPPSSIANPRPQKVDHRPLDIVLLSQHLKPEDLPQVLRLAWPRSEAKQRTYKMTEATKAAITVAPSDFVKDPARNTFDITFDRERTRPMIAEVIYGVICSPLGIRSSSWPAIQDALYEKGLVIINWPYGTRAFNQTKSDKPNQRTGVELHLLLHAFLHPNPASRIQLVSRHHFPPDAQPAYFSYISSYKAAPSEREIQREDYFQRPTNKPHIINYPPGKCPCSLEGCSPPDLSEFADCLVIEPSSDEDDDEEEDSGSEHNEFAFEIPMSGEDSEVEHSSAPRSRLNLQMKQMKASIPPPPQFLSKKVKIESLPPSLKRQVPTDIEPSPRPTRRSRASEPDKPASSGTQRPVTRTLRKAASVKAHPSPVLLMSDDEGSPSPSMVAGLSTRTRTRRATNEQNTTTERNESKDPVPSRVRTRSITQPKSTQPSSSSSSQGPRLRSDAKLQKSAQPDIPKKSLSSTSTTLPERKGTVTTLRRIRPAKKEVTTDDPPPPQAPLPSQPQQPLQSSPPLHHPQQLQYNHHSLAPHPSSSSAHIQSSQQSQPSQSSQPSARSHPQLSYPTQPYEYILPSRDLPPQHYPYYQPPHSLPPPASIGSSSRPMSAMHDQPVLPGVSSSSQTSFQHSAVDSPTPDLATAVISARTFVAGCQTSDASLVQQLVDICLNPHIPVEPVFPPPTVDFWSGCIVHARSAGVEETWLIKRTQFWIENILRKPHVPVQIIEQVYQALRKLVEVLPSDTPEHLHPIVSRIGTKRGDWWMHGLSPSPSQETYHLAQSALAAANLDPSWVSRILAHWKNILRQST
ncbi:hypothetical protein SISNIDRAFT_459893 [Sistotremastrum niveocremeum HHB9708]|uniref:Uncharacterized protein n=1 Tax=Sistotremastrum niveocremeum HHB9708 TaxID=1314777 RepID=A0A164P6N5_9AGAM|nr:hypothetical protein SISNIDRAFT_459893 [Sistotremastrum niveocremeum HHB9708]